MNRLLSAALVAVLCTPAAAQTVDKEGAAKLSDSLARYIGSQAIEKKLVAVEPDGEAYKVTIDFKSLMEMLPKQQLVKFDFAPYVLSVKPRSDGTWDVSSGFPSNGSFEINGPEGPQSMEIAIKDGKFAGVYDPELATLLSASSTIGGMTLLSKDKIQQAEVSTGAGSATVNSTKSADGGVDFTMSQKIVDFTESVKVDDPESGLKFPLGIRSPELTVDSTGKGLRTKAFLDLLAFGVANGDEAKFKANQAEFKSLLLAALPLWQRFDGSYGFKDFIVESPVGTFSAAQLVMGFGTDGISQNGTATYSIKASGLTIPQQLVPAWGASLLPTEVDFKFGGANLDLDTMARKAIEAMDVTRKPPLPEGFGDKLAADFMARNPKLVIGHSTVKTGSSELSMEGEVTFPSEKPEINLTVDIAGYDKIVESLQAASKSSPELAQYVPAVLAIKGFGKTLPDGRIEWAVNGKPDGSVTVNGVMIKPADPVGDDDAGTDDDGMDGSEPTEQ